MEAADITESDFRGICQSAGWKIDWQTDYFKEPQPIYKVFRDLIEPEGYGFFTSDEKPLIDIFNGLRKHLPLDGVTFDVQTQYVVRSLTFPYRTIPRYQALNLIHDGKKMEIAGNDRESLVRQIVDIASHGRMSIMRSADSFYDDNDEYDSYDFYVVVPAGITPGQLAPFGYTKWDEIADAGALLSAVDRAAASEYVYVPYITTNYVRAEAGGEVGSISVLTYDNEPAHYSSRVLPGQTLIEAIKGDFEKDFKYHGAFTVADFRFLDYADDETGNKTPRIAVHVQVEPFDVTALTILDKTPQWQTMPDNVFAYHGLGLGMRADPVDRKRD